MPNKKRLYWDSDVFISYFEQNPTRIATIDDLLEQSKRGEVEIVTSTLTVVEVAFTVGERTTGLDPNHEAAMDSFWSDNDVVTLVELSMPIARGARSLMRYAMSQGLKLKPPDAIHLASATLLSASELHSYNFSDFDKFEPQSGVKAMEPYVVQGTLGLTGGTT